MNNILIFESFILKLLIYLFLFIFFYKMHTIVYPNDFSGIQVVCPVLNNNISPERIKSMSVYKISELTILCNYAKKNNKSIRYLFKKMNHKKYCTTIYIDNKNFYYGIGNSFKISKLKAAKNALKYNNLINEYAKKYENNE